MEYITLRQLAGVIKLAIQGGTPECWVVAEIAAVNVNRKSGHCYVELVERQEEQTVAQMKGTLWAAVFRRVNESFREATGKGIEAGMKILMLARPVFHEIYGLSLNIKDIDPAYTLGEMALLRKQTIERLSKEGLLDRNKALPLPPVIQRIALIASGSSAGYGDFMNKLQSSPYGHRFSVTLYEAYMQGAMAEKSIVSALRHCASDSARYDAVVLIRGGGSQIDLQCFDGYALAREIALFPLPVLSGIGHERDETVTDKVASVRLMTPTAVADYILSRARAFEESVERLASRMAKRLEGVLALEKGRLLAAGRMLRSAAGKNLSFRRHELSGLALSFRHTAISAVSKWREMLERSGVMLKIQSSALLLRRAEGIKGLVNSIRLLDPKNILKRGYSITLLNDKAVADAAALKRGDIITTLLYRGTVESSVKELKGGDD